MANTSETRVALVTGGAKGIGAEVCARLAALGHHVLIADLDLDAAATTAREFSKAIPMNRYGTCGEIASAVVYLVSDDARYVTGISMPVDGGFLASGARGL
jgi:NAD(P)-dependent dehydrogenase (short-subunit alcohol dehydrogenase family)